MPQEEMADETTWYVDGSVPLRMDELLAAFQQSWEHPERWGSTG